MASYLFAPNQERADNFLRDNRFGLRRDDVTIRLSYSNYLGESYTSEDVLYILDGLPPKVSAGIQANVMLSRGNPLVISVEER